MVHDDSIQVISSVAKDLQISRSGLQILHCVQDDINRSSCELLDLAVAPIHCGLDPFDSPHPNALE